MIFACEMDGAGVCDISKNTTCQISMVIRRILSAAKWASFPVGSQRLPLRGVGWIEPGLSYYHDFYDITHSAAVPLADQLQLEA